jgi:hypothetical protein
MENPQKGEPSSPSAALAGSTFSAFEALVDTPGRRGVRIFGLPRNELLMASVASMLFVLPLAIVIGMMPFWERVSDFFLLKQLNSYVAPSVEGLSFEYRAGRFPVKRFLISCISMVELIFLSNLIALFARGVRKHGLLVWTCCDRTKLFRYFGISGLIFFGLWYVLFFDWTITASLMSTPRIRAVCFYFVMGMPFVAFVFGHMAAILGLGAWRAASRKLRRLRRATV